MTKPKRKILDPDRSLVLARSPGSLTAALDEVKRAVINADCIGAHYRSEWEAEWHSRTVAARVRMLTWAVERQTAQLQAARNDLDLARRFNRVRNEDL